MRSYASHKPITCTILTMVAVFLSGGSNQVFAQAFSSGSTGASGALAPASNTTIALPADGILHYTTVTIPAGVTVSFQPNATNTPVTLLATGDVSISGTLNLNGTAGTGNAATPLVNAGGLPGPGGFAGGQSGARGNSNNDAADGQGPGGGAATSGGFGSTGGTYGPPSTFVSLIPLFGGSGGGGFKGTINTSGLAGGGGGGAIVIASSTKITVNGTITAKGGNGAAPGYVYAGGGSGGAIRLVAPEIAGTGTLDVSGGAGGNPAAGGGRVRLEAFKMEFAGSVVPSTSSPSISTVCGPVTTLSTPPLASVPALTISSIAGVAVSSTTGSYATADVLLPPETTNPVTVVVTGTNIPVGSTFKLKHVPQFSLGPVVSTATSTGTLASSTATFSVTLPLGRVSVLNAYSDFTLP
ncbi:MAG: hypothetical protein AB1555_19705 [Nitrospirota bacterium]